jgi:aspartate/methionine/tyrosine aminotransferase
VFSSRTPASLASNRLTEALDRRRRAGLPVVDLTLTNPTRAGIGYPREEILAALGDAAALTYEPTPRGLPAALEAVARHHARQGNPIHPDHLILAGSTSEAYSWLFKLLCDAGDEVLVPRPSYPLFECLATLDSVHTVQYPLLEALDWDIDFETLDSLCGPRARAIVVVNPNNPTGHFTRPATWLRIQEFAARRQMAVISDEVFFDYLWDGPVARQSALSQAEALTFTLCGLSKSAGLPQMKLGWLHAGGPDPVRACAMERLEWIADAYLPVSAPVQHAATAWLDLIPKIQASIRERCRANREALRTAFPAGGSVRQLPAEGGWCNLLDVPRVRSEEEWALRLLEREGVLLQPGYFFDFGREAVLCVSLLTPITDMGEGIARLVRMSESA